MRHNHLVRVALAGGAAFAIAGPGHAAIAVFQGDLAGFNLAAGSPGVAVDFDNPALGDITGATLNGVTFSSPDGNTLNVVDASSTFSTGGFGGPSNVLPATSGARVLSPGGAELPPGPDLRQRDSLQLDFAGPVTAFGIDVLFQSLDCCSFTNFAVYSGATQVASGGLNTSGNGAGGSLFVGFVSDDPATNITRVVFSEFDDNDQNPDSNVGYDTLRIAGAGGVPEPGVWALMILGFGAVGVGLRRRAPRPA